MIAEILPLAMFATLCMALLLGYPVALTLAGIGLTFAGLGIALDLFEPAYLRAFPNRILGAMRNQLLIAVPLFILMGTILERSGIAADLLQTMQKLLARFRGGLAYTIIIVGALLAASTGIVGATVVTMTLLALPTMLEQNYDKRMSCGIIAASGTLGQIIPPSIILIVLADVIANANSEAARARGIIPEPVSVGDMFSGALVPGLILVATYMAMVFIRSKTHPETFPKPDDADNAEIPDALTLTMVLGAPIILMIAVLGSILGGLASPTEAAAIGAVGAIFLAGMRCCGNADGKPLSLYLICGGVFCLVTILILTMLVDTSQGTGALIALAFCIGTIVGCAFAILEIYRAGVLGPALDASAQMTSMVFLILVGAALFSIVFRGLGGDEQIAQVLGSMPGGMWGALAVSMLVMFVLGFVLDFLEITFILVPLVAPQLIALGADPVWLGVLIALNLQTSFLTPPFGFALFYLKGAAPESVASTDIWRGATPFIIAQLLVIAMVAAFPGLIWQTG